MADHGIAPRVMCLISKAPPYSEQQPAGQRRCQDEQKGKQDKRCFIS